SIVEYYKGLIAIRKRFPQFRLKTAEEIRARLSFEDLDAGAFAEHIDDLILLVNPTDSALNYTINGQAEIYADGRKASEQPLYSVDSTISAYPHSITLAKKI
ncbi:MAG: type I pullulanase, partial [Oscillospiraceae bacterium]